MKLIFSLYVDFFNYNYTYMPTKNKIQLIQTQETIYLNKFEVNTFSLFLYRNR